jgi:ribosome-associated protein
MSYRYSTTKITWFIKQVWSKEVEINSTKSSGPGWQHVNKNQTKVQLTRNVAASDIIPKVYKQKLIERNKMFVTQDWFVRIDTWVHRTKKANTEQTYKKLAKIIKSAFKEEVVRKKTVPPTQAVDKRIAQKRKRSKSLQTRKKIVG